jgi:exopolysaccharide biosynthesis polyprenyl glycosylphosphotransferase
VLLDHRDRESTAAVILGGSRDTSVRNRALVRVARRSSGWRRVYRATLMAQDTLLALVAAVVVSLTDGAFHRPTDPSFGAAVALVFAWPALLAASGAYVEAVHGAGSDEYQRTARAGLILLALTGFVSTAADLDLGRVFVVVSIPALVGATVIGRHFARRRLHRLRRHGNCMTRTVVVGRGGAVLELTRRLRLASHTGLEVVAACVTPADRQRVTSTVGVPVAGLDEVVEMALRYGADTVAVTSASETAATYLRRLSWQLEGTGLTLLVAPGLIEVAGPRLHIRPFEGLPLLAVEQPRFDGWTRVIKGVFDRVVAGLGLLLLAPALLIIALAVRVSSPGPVLYRQERVGIQGQTFMMLKFRSMVVDAEQRLEAIRTANISDGLLFKVRDDPRVTSVGRWLRRFSLDELPQLINVLAGTMSLVGPRPPLPREVAGYDAQVRRRLLVKPGLTGLWQISGRSDLPWEEAVQLDLRYVENWSLALDAQILWKTARAVLTASGAY